MHRRHWHICCRRKTSGFPFQVRVTHQVGIVIAGIVRYFLTRPGRFVKRLLRAFQFDLRYYQPGIIAVKFIYFPDESAVFDAIPSFFDQWPQAQCVQHLAGMGDRNRVFVFVARGAFGVALEIKERLELNLLEEKVFNLDELIERKVDYGKSFICVGQPEGCDRKCSVSLIVLDGKKIPFGGACNKYYEYKKTKSKCKD